MYLLFLLSNIKEQYCLILSHSLMVLDTFFDKLHELIKFSIYIIPHFEFEPDLSNILFRSISCFQQFLSVDEKCQLPGQLEFQNLYL